MSFFSLRLEIRDRSGKFRKTNYENSRSLNCEVVVVGFRVAGVMCHFKLSCLLGQKGDHRGERAGCLPPSGKWKSLDCPYVERMRPLTESADESVCETMIAQPR